MAIDIELTLNRWGFGRVATNKLQVGCFRFSVWPGLKKYAVCFEVNWRGQ